jgi:hypothetical protein
VFNQNLNRAFILLAIDAGLQNQLARLLQEDFEQVLQRPIETTPFHGTWPPRLHNLAGVCSPRKFDESRVAEAYNARGNLADGSFGNEEVSWRT